MMISIVNQFKYIEEKMPFISLWEKMLQEVEWCKKMQYKHFNKDMILAEDDERNFKNADRCHICIKKYSAEDVRETIVILLESTEDQLIKIVG